MKFIKKKQENHEENHFWISISDLMTSLLFIFILILAYMILEYQDKQNIVQKKIKAFERNINTRSELLQKLESDLSNKGIHVEIDTNEGAMRITKEKLFDSAKADIKEDKIWIIKEIAEDILNFMKQDKYHNAINTIYIEGHTDNVHLNKSKCGFRWTNMELSAQRAINTFLLMDKLTNGEFSKLKNKEGKALISYSGYGDTRPIASNDTKEGRERNRRIEFFFAVNPPDIKEIKNEN
jgi:chemotaxis protein MotB